MVTKRLLSREERDWSARLRLIWERKKADLGLTQEQVALECGWQTQAAFGHYLTGKNPLNMDAVFKLAKVLEVDPREIMPELHETLRRFFPELSTAGEGVPLNEEVLRLALAIQSLPAQDRASLSKIVAALAQSMSADCPAPSLARK